MAVEAAGEIELEQRHLHGTARCAGEPDDLVHRHRRGAEQLLDLAECFAVELLGGLRLIGGCGRGDGRLIRLHGFHDLGGVLDQRGAVADQLVAALRARVERRAGHGHHLAPGLGGGARGHQRAGARRGRQRRCQRSSPR
jgi:hypothetical protein